jgi:hypothetical protein
MRLVSAQEIDALKPQLKRFRFDALERVGDFARQNQIDVSDEAQGEVE